MTKAQMKELSPVIGKWLRDQKIAKHKATGKLERSTYVVGRYLFRLPASNAHDLWVYSGCKLVNRINLRK